MRLTLDVDADIDELTGLLERSEDLRPAFREIADDIRSMYAKVFARRGPSGSPWAPLTPGWSAYKSKTQPGPQGIYTGLLRSSLIRKGGRHVEKIAHDTVTVGTTAPHAHLFHDGRGGQRARKLSPSKRDVSRAGVRELESHLRGGGYSGLL